MQKQRAQAKESLSELTTEIVVCRRCPRLTAFREEVAKIKRAAFRNYDYWGRPLSGFGDPEAELLIVGLAPAAHGGNRTGRMFTGDGSAAFLMSSLHRFGFANQPTSTDKNDGLRLKGAYMLAVVRCVPPDNKPLPSEIINCRGFLQRETKILSNVSAVLALGKIAMDGYLNGVLPELRGKSRPVFKHGSEYDLSDKIRMFVSYHPSRQNTQTGRLTTEMFDSVIKRIKKYLG